MFLPSRFHQNCQAQAAVNINGLGGRYWGDEWGGNYHTIILGPVHSVTVMDVIR